MGILSGLPPTDMLVEVRERSRAEGPLFKAIQAGRLDHDGQNVGSPYGYGSSAVAGINSLGFCLWLQQL